MTQGSPTWNHLPPFFKQDIVGLLDYKSRCRLRLCSWTDRNIVDACPLLLKCVQFTTTTVYKPEVIHICLKDESNRKIVNKTDCHSDVSRQFLHLFHHQKSCCDVLKIDSLQRNNEQIEEWLRDLASQIRETDDFVKIRAKKLVWKCDLVHGKVLAGLLERLDEKILEDIYIWKMPESFEDAVSTNQWRNVRSIKIFHTCSIPIEYFLHVHKLLVRFDALRPDDIWKLIQTFISENRPLQSYFFISAQKPINPEEILNHFDVLPINDPVVAHQDEGNHTQRFRMATRENIFVVEIRKQSVFGAVCRVDHLPQDRLDNFYGSHKFYK